MADVFAEVDEALKRERLQKLWERYGGWLIGGVLLIVLGTAAVSGYRAWQISVKTRDTAALLAIIEAGNFPENVTPGALPEDITAMRPGMRGLTLISAAGTYLSKKQPEKALSLYQAVADEQGVPQDIKDLAVLMQVRLRAGQEGAAAQADPLLVLLEPVWTNAASPWRWHARLEAATLLAHAKSDYEKAREHLDSVIRAPDLPHTLYDRAQALEQVYGLKQPAAAQVPPAPAKEEG